MTCLSVAIVEANLADPRHQRDVVAMTAAYARDVMGNGSELPAEVLERLVQGLREHPTTLVFLAYCGEQPVGIATCFRGFSTFLARPLINLHDFSVLPECRGQGVGRALLQALQRRARELGCAKITLEVQEKNARARGVYAAAGFEHALCGEANGGALFYAKVL